MKIKLFTITLIAFNLTACASQELNKTPEGMKVATKESIADCKFLGDIHGISSLYGVFAEVALAKSRQQAFTQAKELGANTVVWEPFSTQYGSTSVHGNAYKCQ
jgi:hypothetical protein